MLETIILLSFLFIFSIAHGPDCYLPQSAGTSANCGNATSMRFHFDPDKNECHGFQYLGCGGNLNNHESLAECYDKCVGDWRKYYQCPLGSKSLFNNNGAPQCALSDSGEGCDNSAATCVNFYDIGMCCNRTIVQGLAADKSENCPSGKSRYLVEGFAVLGDSCGDLSCPDGFSCQTGNFYSYCCQN